jgi:hypothetical protein
VEGLLFDANGFRVRNRGDTIGGLSGDGDRDERHLLLRGLGLFLEVLNHPILLLHGIASTEVVAGLVVAGPFGGRAGWRSRRNAPKPAGTIRGDRIGFS